MRDTLDNLVPNANAREFMARRRRHHRSTDVLNMCCVDGMHGASILCAVERADDLLKTFTVRLEFRAKQFRVTKHSTRTLISELMRMQCISSSPLGP